mgnify:CR=1 FL=1
MLNPKNIAKQSIRCSKELFKMEKISLKKYLNQEILWKHVLNKQQKNPWKHLIFRGLKVFYSSPYGCWKLVLNLCSSILV